MSRDYNKCQRQVHVQARVVCNVKICYWSLNFAWANGEERSTPPCNERYFVVLRETTLNALLVEIYCRELYVYVCAQKAG